jgi:hypothetical protein
MKRKSKCMTVVKIWMAVEGLVLIRISIQIKFSRCSLAKWEVFLKLILFYISINKNNLILFIFLFNFINFIKEEVEDSIILEDMNMLVLVEEEEDDLID